MHRLKKKRRLLVLAPLTAFLCLSLFCIKAYTEENAPAYKTASQKEEMHPLFKHLPEKYCVSFGNRSANTKAIFFFSLSCPKCKELFRKDFAFLKKKYVDTGDVFWTFHPDPADIPTLQLLSCMTKLSDLEKAFFLERVMEAKSVHEAPLQMQKTLKMLGRSFPLPDLEEIKQTSVFEDAYHYVSQKNAPTQTPTIEINRRLEKGFPSRKMLEKVFSSYHANETKKIGGQSEA